MSKIMVLSVNSMTSDYFENSVQPWKRLVAVEDEVEFLGSMRAVALLEVIEALESTGRKDTSDLQADVLRTLKINLEDTGYTEFPEDHMSQQALYKKVRNGRS